MWRLEGITNVTIAPKLQVTMLTEHRQREWIVRELQMHHLLENTCRTVVHFHYAGWPDFGVPEKPSSLVHFVRAFRDRVPAKPELTSRPTVVHCRCGKE